MKIEDQVCSLEYSKKLKKLGVKQESLLYWNENDGKIGIKFSPYIILRDTDYTESYAAFTAIELMEMLPSTIGNSHFEISKDEDEIYGIEYICLNNAHAVDKNLCNAIAKTLIYLLENKLIEV